MIMNQTNLNLQVGEERLMGMFQALCGDYSAVGKSYGEDVLISGNN